MKRTKEVKLNKFLIASLVLISVIALISTLLSNTVALAATSENKQFHGEKKIYNQTNIEDDFDDSCVMVVMDKYSSAINKLHNGKFKKLLSSITSIQDLTRLDGDGLSKMYLDSDNFRQILKINLTEKSKQNVLKTIKEIEKIDGVLWAGVNSYYTQATLDSSDTYDDFNNTNVLESMNMLDAIDWNNLPSAVSGSRFPQQWGLYDGYGINAIRTWTYYSVGSRKVRVGVIDTGIAEHEDLKSNVAAGWDFVKDNEITDDDPNGHGTRVAGIIGAAGKNANGVVGVSWNVTLVPLQVSKVVLKDNGEVKIDWPYDAIERAITWAINNDIDILNFSGGGTRDDPAIKAALNNYKGLFVCSAGNRGDGTQSAGWNNDINEHYPSNYSYGQSFSDRVISVGSIDSQGKIADTSNYGATTVSVFAPGVDILSTFPTYLEDKSGYNKLGGTSFAAPFVTGIAALLYSEYEGNNFNLSDSYIAEQVKSTITYCVVEDSKYKDKCSSGGYVNAEWALDCMLLREAMSGFGFESGLNKWIGKVELLISNIENYYFGDANIINVTNGERLQFAVGTSSVYNAWTKITGTIKLELKNSSGEILPIENQDSHICELKVGIVSNASITNNEFTINTKNLKHDTYTLNLSTTITRGSKTYYDNASFKFIVW